MRPRIGQVLAQHVAGELAHAPTGARHTSFVLPVDAATQTFGILAKKGAGKSNAAVVMAESFHAAGVPWVAVDPKGDWWGIRSSRDGKGPGLPVVVFGGRHGDVPLEPSAGVVLADLVIDRLLTCVLDVSEFTKGEQRRFLLAFAERLYRRAEADPIHLFLEEAHEYLPQQVRGPDAELVGAFQRIVKQGRFKGIGCTLVSQRSASLNKDVLTQIDTLIVLRTMSPQDRAAVKAWVDTHDAASEMLADLPTLPNGQAWLWSPEFLGTFVKIQFDQRATFDSGATPQVGKTRREPATLADVDLAEITEAMAATIERAQADDPKWLRTRIAELEDALRKEARHSTKLAELLTEATERLTQARAEPQTILVPDLAWFPLDRLEDACGALRDVSDAFTARASETKSTQVTFPNSPEVTIKVDPAVSVRPDRRLRILPAPPAASSAPGDLSKAERAILTVLAQHGPRTIRQIAMLTGYSSKGGGFRNALSKLRTGGAIERGDPVALTELGARAIADCFEPLPTGYALFEWWIGQLSLAERKIVTAVYQNGALAVETLADITGYSSSGGGFRNALSALRTKELITRGTPIDLHPDFKEAIG